MISERVRSLVNTLDQHKDLRELLYIRGFLLTNDDSVRETGFPFYSQWNITKIGGMYAYTHPLTGFFYYEKHGKLYFLLGHAYNPFTMEHEEQKILAYIAEQDAAGDIQEAIDELTGIFLFGIILSDGVLFQVDPSGLQSAYYGCIGNHFFLTSHPQLAGDVYDLTRDAFAQELIDYKWYSRVKGGYLPADLSVFREIKRVVPNIAYRYCQGAVEHRRFYPLKPSSPCAQPEEYQKTIAFSADILKKNMQLVTRKWKNPHISLSGGVDSNTTFAAANGVYDQVKAFSYISAPKEVIDADAAVRIAQAFSVPMHVLEVPQDEAALRNYHQIVAIIDHNNGYACTLPGNEYRKRIYLREALADLECSVEVKSWVSELVRAYWYKHFNRKTMPPLSAKLYRNLYKLFFGNRALAHKVDETFETYLREYAYDQIPAGYDASDFFYSEVSLGSWAGPIISEMKMDTDMTVIYNNRKLLDALLRVPLSKRISDQHHMDMKEMLNQELFEMNIQVRNMTETDLRAFLLNCVFTANMLLP